MYGGSELRVLLIIADVGAEIGGDAMPFGNVLLLPRRGCWWIGTVGLRGGDADFSTTRLLDKYFGIVYLVVPQFR